MNRSNMIEKITSDPDKIWDVVVIGGGATGLGTAVDAASRGFSTVLVEKADFAKGTSSRSTKLVHGGVRYLAQGDITLVLEALQERGLLRQNAPHLVKNQSFIIPNYEWWDGPFYTMGMKLYDWMSGKLGLGPSELLSKEEVMEFIPNLSEEGLKGGVKYYDGQFDDSRLAVNLAQTSAENGGVLINYMSAIGLLKDNLDKISGVKVRDEITGETYTINAKSVINATGVFVDDILKYDDPDAQKLVVPSQGVHVVLDRSFLQADSAIMIPKTSDGRVLFAVPWHGEVVVGTTDTLVDKPSLEPRALEQEIEFILTTAGTYLKKQPKRSDVKSIFAGLRPLAAPKEGKSKTKEISRNHKLIVSMSGLITVVGGKWTTYRKMAEDILEKAILVGGLDDIECVTKNMPIHGYVKNPAKDRLKVYGTDASDILKIEKSDPEMAEKIHKDYLFTKAQVVWAVRDEMAQTIEDVLARRIRFLFMDAKASMEAAPVVADIMATEMGKSDSWKKNQIREYRDLAKGYLLQ